MLNFKCLGRFAACLLLCAILISVLPEPALALQNEAIPTDVAVIVDLPGVIQNRPEVKYEGHQVSKVHRKASYGSTVIGCFENNTKLTVLETKGDFYKVDCFDMVGYIAKSQVKVENGEYYVNCVEDSTETKYIGSYKTQEVLTIRSQLINEAMKHLGVRYVSGGTSPKGFDCSGFTQYVYNKLEIELMRSVSGQLSDGIIVAKEDLQCGDLIIFSNTGSRGGFASHVGIYIGNNQVIHASSSRGIAINDLDATYYTKHYQCARRVVLTDLAPTVSIPTGSIAGLGGSSWR